MTKTTPGEPGGHQQRDEELSKGLAANIDGVFMPEVTDMAYRNSGPEIPVRKGIRGFIAVMCLYANIYAYIYILIYEFITPAIRI